MSKLTKQIVELNKYLFPFLLFAAFASLGIETYTYIGFLRQFIFVDSRFFLVLGVVSAVVYKSSKKLKYSPKLFVDLSKKFIGVNKILMPVFFVTYLGMQFLEALHFHNYVFSTYHLQQTNFLYLVLFSFAIYVTPNFMGQYSIFKKTTPPYFIIVFIALIAFLNGAVKTVDAAVFTDTYILLHSGVSYDYKMNERWGVYYDYIKFVESNTPKNTSILVPPQMLPWYSTGNVGLDRYFLFPRVIGSGSYDAPIEQAKYKYIMLVWGEWGGADKIAYGWPKVPVNAKRVIYFNPSTKEVVEKAGDFDPKSIPLNGAWGIIETK